MALGWSRRSHKDRTKLGQGLTTHTHAQKKLENRGDTVRCALDGTSSAKQKVTPQHESAQTFLVCNFGVQHTALRA